MMTQQEQPEADQSQSDKMECPLCGKDFEDKAMLNIHFYVHAPKFSTTQDIKEETSELNKEETDIIRHE